MEAVCTQATKFTGSYKKKSVYKNKERVEDSWFDREVDKENTNSAVKILWIYQTKKAQMYK